MSGLKGLHHLSSRINWLLEYYFKGAERRWNNEYTCFTTGTPWDIQFNELTYYTLPEVFPFLSTIGASFRQAARPVALCGNFWSLSLPERRAWFVREVMIRYVPKEILPGDLIAGGRFNIQTSLCLNRREAKAWNARVLGRRGVRTAVMHFHREGYGKAGVTSGHIIPGYERILRGGFKSVYQEITERYAKLSVRERRGPKGDQLRAMMSAAEMPKLVADGYAELARSLAAQEKNPGRVKELSDMVDILKRVPWEPATNFWEAVQSLWITHMLVMSDENYPGAGLSFGRIDQYLLPYWEASRDAGMDREFAKEILRCFWIHCSTAHDARIRTGNHEINEGSGQLITLSGLGCDLNDKTNELTYMILEVVEEMSPIHEPKVNVRLHRKSPEKLIDTLIGMITRIGDAPFILNFDERSMAGLLREARIGGYRHLISERNVAEYASVGCYANTMVGNDRSGTADASLNLFLAVERALTGGRDFRPSRDTRPGTKHLHQVGPRTGNPESFVRFAEFFEAWATQLSFIMKKCVSLYERSEELISMYFPRPYLSCLVKGCAEKGLDVSAGGAEINFVTLTVTSLAKTVDFLLTVKYLVFDKRECTMEELIRAFRADWKGYETLKTKALKEAPRYGRNNEEADALGQKVIELLCAETYTKRTNATRLRFRPGMFSGNEESAQSLGKILGGRGIGGDYLDYINYIPNGACYTTTIDPSLLRGEEYRGKFKALLLEYAENGGTALHIAIFDHSVPLRDALEQSE